MNKSQVNKHTYEPTGTGEKVDVEEQQVLSTSVGFSGLLPGEAQVDNAGAKKVREKPGPKPGSKNERSMANLSRSGRTPAYGVTKRSRTIRITDEAWNSLQEASKERGVSLSEWLEQLARDKASLADLKPLAPDESVPSETQSS